MKRILIALMVALSASTMVIADAEAKRLGGGGSFGRQSQGFSRPAPTHTPNQSSTQNQANQARPAAPANTPQGVPPRPASPWKNILGGALLGLGLGALLSHFGIGGALASAIGTFLMLALIVVAVMFLVRLFRGRNGGAQPRPAYAGAQPYARNQDNRTPEIGSRLEPQMRPAAFSTEPVTDTAAPAVPAGFDTASFLRHAKTYFIRLQAAWDRADVNDIREFTTPEMFGELRLQLQERGASANHTDVVSLEGELLGMETLADEYLASVKFSGMIKEDEGAPAAPFAEIWNLTKPVSGPGGWLLAGIQQIS